MLIIPIKDGENIDRALKALQRNLIKKKTGTVRQVRAINLLNLQLQEEQ